MRIAMWSGPRNISTAMMRSWESRGDTFVCDEPFYAYYLARTGSAHPLADEIVAHGETNWQQVVAWLTGPPPEGKPIFYQKHMAHHLLQDVGREWLREVNHCLLLRDPGEMLASLEKILPRPVLADTGLPQQLELFHFVRDTTGRPPPVLDTGDVLANPRAMLERLCGALDVSFTDRMLSWPPGRRATDGIWAKHWYSEVERSTGFQPRRPSRASLPPELEPLLAECLAIYGELYTHRLTI